MKKVLIDTSVVFASLKENHIHFEETLVWAQAVYNKKIKGYLSTHALAEIYNHLSRISLQEGISSNQCYQMMVRQVIPHFNLIELSTTDYLLALERMALKSLRGAMVYDALHIQAAIKKKLDGIVTINDKDFERLVDKNELQVINPLYQKPL